MSIPYTREAIAQLRTEARRGTPAELVQQHYGWDARRFTTICRRHQIEFGAASSKLAQQRALGHILSKLTSRQSQIFGVLHPPQWRDWISGAYIARVIGVKRVNYITKGVDGLASRLQRMGSQYQIESKLGPGGGYRLVIDKDAR